MKTIKVIISTVISAILYISICILGSYIMFGMMAGAAHAENKVVDGKTIVVTPSQPKEKKAPEVTGWHIVIKGVKYPIFRGPKGGLFYIINGKTKYLTKEQKELVK